MSTQATGPQQQGAAAAATPPPQLNPKQATNAQVQAVAAQAIAPLPEPAGLIDNVTDLTGRVFFGVGCAIRKVALSVIMGISATFLLPTIAAIHLFQAPVWVALTVIDKSMKHIKPGSAAAPNGPAKQGLEKVVDLTKRGVLGVLNVIKKVALGIIMGISAVVLLPTALFAYILLFPAKALNSVIENSRKYFNSAQAPAPQGAGAGAPGGQPAVPAAPPQVPAAGGVPAAPAAPQAPAAGGVPAAPAAPQAPAAGEVPAAPAAPQAPAAGEVPVPAVPWVVVPRFLADVPAQAREGVNWVRDQYTQHPATVKIAAVATIVLSASAVLYTYS